MVMLLANGNMSNLVFFTIGRSTVCRSCWTKKLSKILEDQNVFLRRNKERINLAEKTSFHHENNANVSLFIKGKANVKTHNVSSSVLVLFANLPSITFINSNDRLIVEPWMLLTRRSFRLRSHPGEIAFPGGKLEEGETPEQAALRESYEEIQLNSQKVEMWGALRAIFMSSSSSKNVVVPNVGVLRDVEHLKDLVPSNKEVSTIFMAPLSELIIGMKHTNFRYIRKNKSINFTLPVFFTKHYRVISTTKQDCANVGGCYRIWGISALILHEALCTILDENLVLKL